MTTLATPTLEHKIDDLTQLVSDLHGELRQERARRTSLEELVADAMPMLRSGSDRLAEQLEALERRGYFSFVRAGADVMDEIVTNFGEDDVRQLGEHVVSILDTVKELTQPEILALLNRAVDAVERQRLLAEQESDEPPSLWHLARQARTPEVRRGLARAMGTLAAMNDVPHRTGGA